MLAPSRPTSLLRPAAMADAVARVVSAVIIGGSVVHTAHTIGAFRPAPNKLADAVAEIADTLSKGPRKPRLLHWVTGTANSGCATRASRWCTHLQRRPIFGWVLAFHRDTFGVCCHVESISPCSL